MPPPATVFAASEPGGSGKTTETTRVAKKSPGQRCKPTIIEMFGMPGVGKTTLASIVRDGCHLTRRELTLAWHQLPLRRKCAFLLLALIDVRALGCAARFAFRTRLAAPESLVRLARLAIKPHWMRSHPGKMLLDESFLQEIWSICIAAGRSDPDQETLAKLIRCLYAGLETRILFVEADEAIVSQRISGRSHGRSRLDRLTAAELKAQLARARWLPHAIVAAASAAGLAVERLDGHDPVEVNAERIRTLLASISCGRASG